MCDKTIGVRILTKEQIMRTNARDNEVYIKREEKEKHMTMNAVKNVN